MFNIFLPREPMSFYYPPADGRSGIGVLGPVVLVFVFLFVITGGASWFALGNGSVNPFASAPHAQPKAPPAAH